MVKVRSIARAKRKFEEATRRAGPFYEAGVLDPRAKWDEALLERKEAMYESLREAIEKDIIAGGIRRRKHEGWLERVKRKGRERWEKETPGSANIWETEWAPFAALLAALVLEKKGRKGDPANVMKRVGAVVQALIAKKRELRGVSATA